MRYVSLDLETTGLDPCSDQILMISMVLEDTEKDIPIEDLEHFTCYVSHDRIEGDTYALQMNAWILKELVSKAPKYPVLGMAEMISEAAEWLCDRFPGKVTVAGKNVAGFDMQFIPPSLTSLFRHRVIDAGSVCIDWSKECVPSLGELTGGKVAHDALEDARDVIRVLRTTYKRK